MAEVIRACGPELVLLAGAFLLVLFETLFPGRGGRAKGYFALTFLALAFLPLTDTPGAAPALFAGGWQSDMFSVVFKVVLLLASFLVVFMSIDEQAESSNAAGEYYILVLLATVGMMVMVSGGNLLVIYLGLELMAISFYVLTGFAWSREESAEGALKYVLTGLFASAVIMYGIAMLYGATGSIDLAGIREGVAGGKAPLLALAGLALLTCGLAFKMGAAPFHMWMPDVLEGAPTPVAGFLAVGPKAAVLAVAMRVLLVSLSPLQGHWVPLLWTIAALTILWGNLAAIAQDRVKRMLAYSSISHVGYLLLAVIAASRSGTEGVPSAVFYLTAYTFMNLGAFGTVLSIERHTGESPTWRGLAGLHRRAPGLTALLALFMFSLAGIPPTAGFMGKFWVFTTGWRAGVHSLVFIGLLGSLIGAFYYLRTIYAAYMLPEEEEGEKMPLAISPLAYSLVLAAAGVLVAGMVPRFFMILASRAYLPY